MKQEMELAMKLLEKDIHEKQVSTGVPDPAVLVSPKRLSKTKRNSWRAALQSYPNMLFHS